MRALHSCNGLPVVRDLEFMCPFAGRRWLNCVHRSCLSAKRLVNLPFFFGARRDLSAERDGPTAKGLSLLQLFSHVITPSHRFRASPAPAFPPMCQSRFISKTTTPKFFPYYQHHKTTKLLVGFSQYRASLPSPHRPVDRPARTLWSIIGLYLIFRILAPRFTGPKSNATPKQASKQARAESR